MTGEVIDPSGVSITIILLNSHVVKLHYKYLCSNTQISSMPSLHKRRFLLQHVVVNLETLKWPKVPRIRDSGVRSTKLDSYIFFFKTQKIMGKEVKKKGKKEVRKICKNNKKKTCILEMTWLLY